MYKIPAKTLFTGHPVVFVPECHSTNTLALELCQKHGATEGTVVITDHQTAGRGQRGNAWIADAGQNLTLSLILKPSFLSVKDQFQISMMLSLAIHDFLLSNDVQDVSIKWPNDILIRQQKICGILIENLLSAGMLQYCVCGIGLNINQKSWPIKGVTSLSLECNHDFDLQSCFEQLLSFVEVRYMAMRTAGFTPEMRTAYLNSLYGYNRMKSFSADGMNFKGTICGVDQAGRLQINTEAGMRTFAAKEVSFLD